MAKLKDGFYKLTASSIGSDLLVLLAGGGAKPISDFAQFNNAYWANIPISNTSSTITTPTFGSITVPLTGLIVGSKSTDTSPTRVLTCYDTTLTTKYMNIGNDPSAGNAGEFHYAYSANASTSNNVGLGFYSGNRLKLYYNGGSGVGKAVIASAASGGTEYELLHLGNYKNYVDDLYWANLSVQQTASSTTHPTFGNVSIKGGDDSGLNLHTNAGYTRIRFYNASSVNNATIHYFGTAYSGYDFAKDTLNVLGGSATTIGSWNNPTMYITSNSTTSDNSGKVGIGTTAPNAKLHVNGHTLINKRLTIGLDLGNWDSSRAELELISPSGQANDFWLGSGLRDWSITSRPAAENNTLNFHAHTSSTTTPLVMVLEKSGNTTIYGNLQIGKSDTRNYIAFRGTTGDNPGSFNHTYIGENLWGSSESSELILYKGNDIGSTATTVDASGADRIRHIAGGHLFQIYKSALSGTFETICTSTVPVNMLAIHLNSIQTYAPLVIVGSQYSGNYGINMQNSDIVGINALYTADSAEDGGEGLQFSRGNGYYDSIWASSGTLYFSPNGNLNRAGSYSTNYTVIHSGNIGSQSVNYATSAGNADTVDSCHKDDFLRRTATLCSINKFVLEDIPKGVTQVGSIGWTDYQNHPHAGGLWMTLRGTSSLRTALILFPSYSMSSPPILYSSVDGGAWQGGYQLAYTSQIPTTMAWGNITGKPSTFTPSSHTHDDRYYTESESDSRFINASGDTMTGLLTVTTSSSHGGIKMGDTYVTSINGSVIFQNNDAIRFGSDSWDWNVWAGLKYNHSNKTIYLGLADNSIFTANAALSGGSLRFPGISKAWINTSEGNEVLNLGGWLGTVGNTGWYSVTHKGGWYMIDGSYVRTYNNVRIHTGSLLRDAFNSAGGYYSSWNNSVGNDWTSILNTANAVFSKDNLYVNHGTALPMMTWANTVNSYGYVTRYSIGSVRPTNGAWGILRLCVGNNDAGTSCGCYMDLDGDGSITTNASMYAAHFYENSDILLKLNIQEILNSDKMPIIKEFDWKESGEHSYGLIAQELEEQGYSELVSTKDDGYKTVNYSAALSLIVGKLQVKIKELEEEIEILKNKN